MPITARKPYQQPVSLGDTFGAVATAIGHVRMLARRRGCRFGRATAASL